jgi:hypothetical protein
MDTAVNCTAWLFIDVLHLLLCAFPLQLMGAIRARLSPLSKSLVVPEPVMPLCSSGLIVMQRMRGTSLTSLLAAAKAVSSNAGGPLYLVLLSTHSSSSSIRMRQGM